MRSRISRVATRVSVLGAAAAAALLATAAAAAAEPTAQAAGALDSLSAPVGLTAIGLGVVGMVAGMFRKKKIQPENQRKT
ncbi:PEP-CTERM protein-sorting domain-containing protein [Saccharopolyspora shandongensis]|uniref:PEP-CTERM protein-sorting domain-containing protein n=1 Tax=Saccharopolyspora shandongensis TaxID=418495 RepID=A0A1H3STH7_9PSEU|nr:PEP-CTERM protein-sorting domain-containing protein [Saccharopolyspora shandongensis]